MEQDITSKIQFMLVPKEFGNIARTKAKDMQIQGSLPLLNSVDGNIFIQIKSDTSPSALTDFPHLIPDFQLITTNVEDILTLPFDEKSITKLKAILNHGDTSFRSKILELIEQQMETKLTVDQQNLLPSKWEKIGHVLIFKKLNPQIQHLQQPFATALLNTVPGVLTVVVDEEGIKGELREPNITVLATKISDESPTLTTHVENNIKYRIDVSQCMFSSGNGTERIHFSKVKAPNEIVVDMFAGIGYFAVPLAAHSGLSVLVAIEKNPNSGKFLLQNLQINHAFDNTPQSTRQIVVYVGDNREQANEYLGRADRISMGYIPTPKEFLHRAFDFLKEEGGIIHYHHTCFKEQYEELASQHITEELASWRNGQHKKKFRIIGFRVVKSYAPKLFHCVADVRIENTNE